MWGCGAALQHCTPMWEWHACLPRSLLSVGGWGKEKNHMGILLVLDFECGALRCLGSVVVAVEALQCSVLLYLLL